MPKRKSKFQKEQELLKKCKTEPCSINMALFNPALWIYNYTIDIMKKRNIQLDSNTIVRKMNRCYNAKKPILPISYINREYIYKVIGCAAEFLKISNVETMILECFPETVSDKQVKSKSKSIYKMLTKEAFRQTDLFNRIKINCKVVYERFGLLYCDTDSLKTPVNRKITDDEIEGNNSVEKDIISEINTIFRNCRTQNDFLKCTNVEELAKKEIIKLGFTNIDQLMKKTLIDIIISNTWERLNHIVFSLGDETLQMESSELNVAQSNKESLNDCETLQTQSSDLNVTQPNKDLLLHRYALERIREVKHNPDDTNTIIRIKAQLVNYDKCLIPLSYLEHSEFLQIFPNLFSFIKFTNMLKIYGIHYSSLWHDIMKQKVVIRCIKNEALRVFEKIRNDPDFREKETYQNILVNSKFLFNQNRISSEESNSIDDEIVEYFKKRVPHDNIAKLKDHVNMNSSTDSNNIIFTTRSETRHRVKVLNQIQAKLNVIIEDSIEEETTDSELSSNSDSNVTVINFNPTNNQLTADQQTIVVPEFSTQQTINLADPSNTLHLNKIQGLKEKSSSKPYQQDTSDSQDSMSCLASTSNSTGLEVLPSNDEILTIDDSLTKSQRIEALLDSSPANLSEIPYICYNEVVAKSDKIAEMRGQNRRNPLSKNPELEIPVMRNSYSSLPVKHKK